MFQRASLTDHFPNLPCLWSIPTSESVRPVSLPWLGRERTLSEFFPNSQKLRRNSNMPHCMPCGDWVNCIVRGWKGSADPIVDALSSKESEVRANAARVVGDSMVVEGQSDLLKLLNDPSSRVVSLSAIALGRVASKEDESVVKALFAVAQENQGKDFDVTIRHSLLSAGPGCRRRPTFGLFQIEEVEQRLLCVCFNAGGQVPNLPSSLQTQT